jgi:surface polysaccharide O-acyltransferase-like enzyme
MEPIDTRAPAPPARRTRYDGLDLFRPLSIFGVVLIHFSLAYDLKSYPAFNLAIRLRDCAFPVIVLTSFFVMTRSLLANPGRTFAQFASNRFVRLAVPCAIWSTLYWLMWEVAGALVRGERPSWPPPTLWLTGYAHLWFLPFLFFGALLAFPLVRSVARLPGIHDRSFGLRVAAVFGAAGAAYWVWGRPFLTSQTAFIWLGQGDLSTRVAIGQSIIFAKYTVLGIATAFMADGIGTLYARPGFRAATLLFAAAACVVHVTAAVPQISRAIYSMAVFIVLLRPLPPGRLEWLRPAARYSYPIYIVHPAVTAAVLFAFDWWWIGPSVSGLLTGSVIVFALSGAAAALLRMLVPADWFLPLVPVGKRGAGAGMR